MISAVIIDDEINNANYLHGLLESNIPDVVVKGIGLNVNEGIKLIQTIQPSIVFLDIELQTSTGFDLLNIIGDINFSVIFTTAHERYALKAIKFAALDFLLKPIDKDELKVAINKAVKQKNKESLEKGIHVLIENIRKKDDQKKIAISSTTGLQVLEMKDIVYLQSDGPYTTIYLKQSSKIVSSKHLKEYEELLAEFDFFRIHKSYMVNLTEIKQYSKSEGGFVVMSDGARVDVSQKKKDELINRLSVQVIFI